MDRTVKLFSESTGNEISRLLKREFAGSQSGPPRLIAAKLPGSRPERRGVFARHDTRLHEFGHVRVASVIPERVERRYVVDPRSIAKVARDACLGAAVFA